MGIGLPQGYALLPLLFVFFYGQDAAGAGEAQTVSSSVTLGWHLLLFWDNVLLASLERDLVWNTGSNSK